jgi:hypothetical protein
MIQFRRGYPQHIIYLHAQDVQAEEQRRSFAAADIVSQSAVCQSAWHYERCLGIAGLIDLGDHRAHAWALLGRDVGAFMLPITRRIRQMIAEFPARRFEMVVRADFEQGQRWAEMLGFENETPNGMRSYFVDGDGYQYARVKPWQSRSQSLAA